MYDAQKKQNLENDRLKDQRKKISEERQQQKQDKARQTLRNPSTGKYSKNKRRGEAQQAIRSAKNLAKSATPWGAISLAAQVKLSDATYFLALIASILKGILDIIQATGAGYALIIVLTFLVSIFVAFMMILAGFSEGEMKNQRIRRKMIRRWLVLIGGTAIELIPGISFLPIETLTILVIFFLALSDRKEAKKQIQ